jgi:ubiquinone/menaquinone biosynthesis C-methylase UbiE
MLAVIEHLEKPKEVIKECHRVLKDDGLLIITTPKKAADKFINIVYNDYAKIMGEHKQYFDLNDMNDLLDPLFSIRNYKTFLFGLNQLFVCEKRVMDNLNTLR